MHRTFRPSILALVGLLAGGTMLTGCNKPQAAGPPKNMPPAEVGIHVVQPQTVALTNDLPGRTSAFMIAEVRPQVGGIIQKRLFTEGADVKAGEVLYQIDPASYQAAYASAKAALARAEANIVPVRLKADRYKDLVAVNAVSKQEYDEAFAHLKQAEADIEAAKAALETARINLAYTKVTAPISGRIGKSSVTNGALVTANQAAPLSTIQQLDQVYVDITQSAADLLRLKQSLASGKTKKDPNSAKVKLILENGAPYPLVGTMKFSDVTVDQGTGSITLRSVFPNPKQVLLPGMFVRAVVEEGVVDNALLVPQQGVTRDPAGNATCLVVGAGEKVEPRMLKVSRALGDKWLVEDGLKPGDKVIVEGLQKAKPGSQVKPVPAGSAPAAPGAPAGQAKK